MKLMKNNVRRYYLSRSFDSGRVRCLCFLKKFLSNEPYAPGWDSRTTIEKEHCIEFCFMLVMYKFLKAIPSKRSIYKSWSWNSPRLPRDGFRSLDSSWLMTLNSSFVSLWFPTSGGFLDLRLPNGELGTIISPFVSNSENEPLFRRVTLGDSLNIKASSSNGLFKLLFINDWLPPLLDRSFLEMVGTGLFPLFWEFPENFLIVAGE